MNAHGHQPSTHEEIGCYGSDLEMEAALLSLDLDHDLVIADLDDFAATAIASPTYVCIVTYARRRAPATLVSC